MKITITKPNSNYRVETDFAEYVLIGRWSVIKMVWKILKHEANDKWKF